MKRRALLATAASATATGLAAPSLGRAETATEISFLFPVAVGGPITKIIDGYARDFEAETPGVKVRPVYAGSYVDTLTKAQASLKDGDGPTMAVLRRGGFACAPSACSATTTHARPAIRTSSPVASRPRRARERRRSPRRLLRRLRLSLRGLVPGRYQQ